MAEELALAEAEDKPLFDESLMSEEEAPEPFAETEAEAPEEETATGDVFRDFDTRLSELDSETETESESEEETQGETNSDDEPDKTDAEDE